MNLQENIPGLAMAANDDGTITLEQYVSGNAERVAIHPIHVRLLAQRLGMLHEVTASDAEMLRTERERVAALRQENDGLKRNMLRLHAHALALQEDFRENADWKHADLAHEMNNINALVDLFDMAVDDFATAVTPGHVVSRQRGTPADAAGAQQVRRAGCAPLKAAPLQLDLEGGHVR